MGGSGRQHRLQPLTTLQLQPLPARRQQAGTFGDAGRTHRWCTRPGACCPGSRCSCRPASMGSGSSGPAADDWDGEAADASLWHGPRQISTAATTLTSSPSLRSERLRPACLLTRSWRVQATALAGVSSAAATAAASSRAQVVRMTLGLLSQGLRMGRETGVERCCRRHHAPAPRCLLCAARRARGASLLCSGTSRKPPARFGSPATHLRM